MVQWIREAWPWVTGWIAFVLAASKALQATFAAERDRVALASAESHRKKLELEIRQLEDSLGAASLQREKLALEVHQLRNAPEVVRDRRGVYDRLRALLIELVESAAPTYEQVGRMYQIQHDSEFAFPRDVADRLKQLNESVFELYWTDRVMREPPFGWGDGQRQTTVANNHAALNQVVAFQQDMVAIFRAHLNPVAE
jgi:hypothetical protein